MKVITSRSGNLRPSGRSGCQTYKQDKKKFWWGLALSIVGAILTYVIVGIFIVFAVWIWTVVDTARKSPAWYRSYGRSQA